MEVRLPNLLLLRIRILRWVTEVLPVLVAMVVVASQPLTLSGVLQLRKALAAASVATRARF